MKELFNKSFDVNRPFSPYFAFISFSVVTLLLGMSISISNSRFGVKSPIISLDSPLHQNSTPLWFALELNGENIRITNKNRDILYIPIKAKSPTDLQEFRTHLEKQVKSLMDKASLTGEAPDLTAILAVDERLRYVHVRPVISALSNAHIYQYGFETLIPGAM